MKKNCQRKNWNAGIYIRLSREDENEKESSSIISQRELLLSFLTKNEYHYVESYIDDGYTGTNFDRPGFNKMLQDIEKGRINMVVVKDLSRLGRNNSKVTYYLDEYFPVHKIRFIAINNDYDSDKPNASQEYAWLTNGINESYCLDISKKVRSALQSRKEKGYFTGWKAPYGYKRSEKDYHKLVIDKSAATIVKRIFKMAYHGKSPSQIADILSSEKIPNPSHYAHLNRGMQSTAYNLWCARTISEMLTNETYIGNLTQGRRRKVNYKLKKQVRTPKEDWIIVENTHESIIDKHTFYMIQNIIKKNRKTIHFSDKLLKGFLYCKECGHSLGLTRSKDGRRYYLGCTYYRKYSKHKVCTPHTINYQKVEDTILETMRILWKENLDKTKLLEQIKMRYMKESKLEKNIKKIEDERQKVEGIEKALDRSYIDYVKDIIDEEKYSRIVRNLKEEMNISQKKIKEWESENSLYIKNKKDNQIKKQVDTFLTFQYPSRFLLNHLIDKICITEDKKIELYLNFKISE